MGTLMISIESSNTMKNTQLHIKAGLVLIAIVIFSACSSSKSEKAFDPVGKWSYKVTTDVSYGEIMISGESGAYKASMTTEVFGTLEVMNLNITGNELTGDLDVGGTPAKLAVDFDGDKMTGTVTAGEDIFPMVGERAR